MRTETSAASPRGTWESAQRIRLVDHHVHGPLSGDVTREQLEMLLTESDRPIPEGTTVFDSQVGFAIRQHCAPLLGLEPGASPEAYVARRSQSTADELAELFLEGAGVSDWVVDTGFGTDSIWSAEQMRGHLSGSVHEIVRLEALLEQVAVDCGPEQLQESFEAAVARAAEKAAGWKSIIAYRFGFDFEPRRPSPDEVLAAARRWLGELVEGEGLRVEDPVLLRWLLYVACDTGLPIQLHCGYGDPDLDLHRCDPLLLTSWLRDIEGSGSRIMLLHCYPFHRNAGYLAQVFPHVYCDVGLSINYSGAASRQIVAESMELTPFSKLLYSSDAWGPPELHYLGSLLWRRATAAVMDRWVDQGDWPEEEPERILQMIGRDNACRVYGLDETREAQSRA
jgi:predicted TIM-barrel fold metal-dependent hydrolase